MNTHDEAPFASGIIKKVARSMLREAGIVAADLPDIEHDIWVELLTRCHSYRPERGHPRAFIALVVKRAAASILETRRAQKRGRGIPIHSLEKEINSDSDDPQELHETISVDDYLRLTRGPVRTEEERLDLAIDVRQFIAKLPPSDRVVCLLLVERDVTDIAGVVGIPRSTLRDLISRVRSATDGGGLDEYRQCAPRKRSRSDR